MLNLSIFSVALGIIFTLLTPIFPSVRNRMTPFSTCFFFFGVSCLIVYFLVQAPFKDYLYLLILCLMSISLSFTDYFYWTVEPFILYPLTLFSLINYYTTHSFSKTNLILPFLTFLIFYFLDYLFPHSIGGGDVKLLIIYAHFLPYLVFLYLILVASSLGIFFFLILNKIIKKDITRLPFVPFLTSSLLLVTLLFL